MKRIFLIGMASLVFLSWGQIGYAEDAEKNLCTQKESKKIKTVIAEYLKTHGAIPVEQTDIFPKRCVKEYALTKIYPKQADTDPASVYLHKIFGHWEVMALGTYFEKSFLQQLPPALRQEAQ